MRECVINVPVGIGIPPTGVNAQSLIVSRIIFGCAINVHSCTFSRIIRPYEVV